MDVINNLTQLSDIIRNNESVIILNYNKNDGTSRNINCTLDFNKIPKDKLPKTFKEKNVMDNMSKKGIIVVFDNEKKGWKSLIIKKIKTCRVGKETIKININS